MAPYIRAVADEQSAEFCLLASPAVLLMYSGRMTEEDAATHNKLIAEFMSVSTQLERYLQEGKSLTTVQLESLSLTVSGLHTLSRFLEEKAWPKKQKSTDVNRPSVPIVRHTILLNKYTHTSRYVAARARWL